MMTEDMQSPEVVRAVDIFLDLFRDEYESLERDGIRNLDDNMYHYLDYIPQWKYIASDVGDVIFVKPLVECIIGVDLITGEELDGYERGMKLLVAAVDLGGVGLAAKAGAGLGVRGVAEVVMIGTATDAVSTINSDVAQMFVKDMGGSDRAAWISGLAAGLATDYASGKVLGDILINPRTETNAVERVSYSSFADGMSDVDRARYIANNEITFFNEFSERASKAGLNNIQIDEAYNAMRMGDFSKMASYLDTSSSVDGAVFWSGNKEGAAAYANSIGGTIMEQTPGGQVLDNWRGLMGMYPEWDTGTALDQKLIWKAISIQYAEGAAGNVTYVMKEGYNNPNSVWKTVEYPILEDLLDDGIVTDITTIIIKE